MIIQSPIHRKLRRAKIFLTDAVLEKNIVRGHKNYQKFIILCRSRTGSNFLVNLLRSHEQVRVAGELFTKKKKVDWGYPITIPAESLELREISPIEFIERVVFREVPKSVSAVGFKLFYYQAQDEVQKSIWPYLQNMEDIKIIHLTRRNILKTHLSRQLAVKNKTWVNTINRKAKQYAKPIELNYNDCIQSFKNTKMMEEDSRKFFADVPVLEVVYEELVRDRERELNRIQDFIKVKQKPLIASTKKQSKQPLSQIITNYAELKQQFLNTPWSEFFE